MAIALAVGPINVAAQEPPAAAPVTVVQLPPFEVAESTALPWRYLALPGIEVLSDCKDETTLDFVKAYARQLQLLPLVLPEEFQVRLSAPRLLILAVQKTNPNLTQTLIPDAIRTSAPAGATVQFLPNMALHDQDIYVDYAIVDEKKFDAGALTLTPAYLQFQLQRRTPPLPPWLVEGLLALWPERRFGEEDLIGFSRAHWLGDLTGEDPATDPEGPRTLLPIGEILSGKDAAPPGDDARNRLRQAETALLIRWALENQDGKSRAALWKLVARSGAGPVPEETFRACFGFGFAAMRDRLSDYWPTAAGTLAIVGPVALPKPPALRLRPATDVEISRIKGDWERLEAVHVKSHYPAYAANYLKQAERTLARTYDRGERDPGLLAVIGLFRCDAGDDLAALPLLETAAHAGVVRPRVYAELARIRYAQLRATGGNPATPLSVAQANSVLSPLTTGYKQAPPLAASYVLAAEVWAHSDLVPGPSQFALLDEGLKFFPDQVGLIERVAFLEATHGRSAEALALVNRSRALVASPADRARLEQLAARLAPRAGQVEGK